MRIEKTARITLTRADIVEAICQFVQDDGAGEGPIVDPETVEFTLNLDEVLSGHLEAVCTANS